MNIGIYKIVCLANDKVYIGSSVNLKKRKREHFKKLFDNKHTNKHLQNSYNKYGLRNFEFHIVEFCDKTKLIELEQNYINVLKPSFNICKIAGSCLGVKRSEETVLKRKLNMPNQAGINNPMYGKKHTEEAKKKMSKKHADFNGTNSAKSLFTNKQIINIRELRKNERIKIKKIAEMYNCSIPTIKRIVSYKSYKNVEV